MALRGIRGATACDENQADSILSAVKDLLATLLLENPTLKPEDVASVLFTVTDDLDAVFPARAARQLGWQNVPLMCAREIPVPGDIPRCIRLLMHWNTDLPQSDIHHVYLKEARRLRPDLSINADVANNQ